MKALLEQIRAFSEEVTFESLGTFVTRFPFDSLDYEADIPEAIPGCYGRNILCLEPFECVLIHWPEGVESAIHLHEGVYGYVVVLEGALDNVFYEYLPGKLVERSIEKFVTGAIIPEPDGVIHKLANTSRQRAITLHFYYPAITTFEGMRIFNPSLKAMGVLSAKATSANWMPNAEGHFLEQEENAYAFTSFEDLHEGKSHIICSVKPKPTSARIKAMNAGYFSEQATQYDFSDFNLPNRKKYIETVDRKIADYFCETRPESVLDIATGTGRRALGIREKSEVNYRVFGVDLSREMVDVARGRGLDVQHLDWATENRDLNEQFHAATFLYAFGHIANQENRNRTLKNVNRHLKPGGIFYLDFFSLKNENEWGPAAEQMYHDQNLAKYGFEKGDVFYKKKGCQEMAFLHYFELDEVRKLLLSNGFEIEQLEFIGYSKNPGEEVKSEREGNIFVRAKKVKAV